MSERHTKQNDFHGQLHRTEKPRGGGAKQNLRVIAAPGCWCGLPFGHDWPGKSDGAPHPRGDA